MRASWALGPSGALQVTVDSGDDTRTWTLRKSHTSEKLADIFKQIYNALRPELEHLRQNNEPIALEDVFRDTFGREPEAPERQALRRAAERVTGAKSIKGKTEEDWEQIASSVPEVSDLSNTGFDTSFSAAVPIDGRPVDVKDLRKGTDRGWR